MSERPMRAGPPPVYPIRERSCCSRPASARWRGGRGRVADRIRREPVRRKTPMRFVLMIVLSVILLSAGIADAGTISRQIPNPRTLLLLTTGLAGLAWWLR